jgi:hypothetical protein
MYIYIYCIPLYLYTYIYIVFLQTRRFQQVQRSDVAAVHAATGTGHNGVDGDEDSNRQVLGMKQVLFCFRDNLGQIIHRFLYLYMYVNIYI